MGKKTFIEGEIIVYLEDCATRGDVEKIAKDLGIALIEYYEFISAARFGCKVGEEHKVMFELVQNDLVVSVDHCYAEAELIRPVKG